MSRDGSSSHGGSSDRDPATDIKPRAYARAYAGMEGGGSAPGDAEIVWRIVRIALRYRAGIAVALLATLAASAFQLAIPGLVGDAVDGALRLLDDGAATPEAARGALYHAALLLLGASILRGVFTLAHNYSGEAIGHRLAHDLRLTFYQKLQRLGFSFHDRIHTGELITRGMLDLEGVRTLINAGLLRAVQMVVLVSAGAALLLTTDTVLGLLSLSFVPYIAWRSTTTRLRLRYLWTLFQDRMAVLGRIMDENLTGIRVVRAFGAEPFELGKYDEAAAEALLLSSRRINVRVASTTEMTFVYFVSMGLVLWVGGERVIAGTMTLGTLTEFLTFITILQLPVRSLGLVVNSFARGTSCGARLFAVIDLEPTIRDAPDARELAVTEGTLRFENVSFAYDEDGPLALDGVSFEVRRGRMLGIVGPPGSGKSTITHLLPRYYDVTGGRIAIDEQDIRGVTLDSLRRAVRVVQQDPFLFTASIDNNIAYGDPWTEEAPIRDAAGLAQIDGFIGRLAEGYETLVGERGVSLSGGQKQRVAIARTALLHPAVLVFDDSTAAIDAATESQIRDALAERAEDTARIVVSHRLAAIRDADEILVLEAGRVIERGTHETLIARGGNYARIFALQARESLDGGLQGAAE